MFRRFFEANTQDLGDGTLLVWSSGRSKPAYRVSQAVRNRWVRAANVYTLFAIGLGILASKFTNVLVLFAVVGAVIVAGFWLNRWFFRGAETVIAKNPALRLTFVERLALFPRWMLRLQYAIFLTVTVITFLVAVLPGSDGGRAPPLGVVIVAAACLAATIWSYWLLRKTKRAIRQKDR